MKCDKPFIIAYNALFKFLDKHGGAKEVKTFWELLTDAVCQELVEAARKDRLAGCAAYWLKTLSAEGADFILNYTKEQLFIQINQCPSYAKMKCEKQTPYENYCGHCAVLYKKALAPLGLSFAVVPDETKGKCYIFVGDEH